MHRLINSAWGHIDREKEYGHHEWIPHLGEEFLHHCRRATTADSLAKGRGCIQCEVVLNILTDKPATPTVAASALQAEAHRLSRTLEVYARRERTARQNRRDAGCRARTE